MSIDLSLNELENSGLIRQAQVEPELEYIFRHALVQDASYESLLKADRRALHATVAQTLEHLYATRLDEFSATLADHYERAENYPKALDYYLRAGNAAAKVYANAEASLLFSRAIELLAIPESRASTRVASDLFSQYGRVLELSGKYEAAIENYRQMQAEAIRRREKQMEMDALIAQAIIQATPSPVHNILQAQLLCEQALAIAQGSQDREAESRIYWILLLVHYFGNDRLKSIEYGEKSLEIARAINNRERMAFTLNDIARTYMAAAMPAKAYAANAEANALWREIGNLPMLADNLTNTAQGYLLSGEFDASLIAAKESYEISDRIKNSWGLGFSTSLHAMNYWQLGDASASLRYSKQLSDLLIQQLVPFGAIMSATLLMEIYCEIGLPQKAREAVVILPDSISIGGFKGIREAIEAYISVYEGNFAQAEEFLEIAIKNINRRNYTSSAPLYIAEVEYHLAMQRGEYEKILAILREQVQHIEQAKIIFCVPLIKIWSANALMELNRLDEAREELNAALELAQRINSRHSIWKAHSGMATLAAIQNDLQTKNSHLQKARETLQYIADRVPEELRASYLNLPEIKKIMQAT